jgi:phage gpG-like protein
MPLIRLHVDTGAGERVLVEMLGRLEDLTPPLTAIKEVALTSIRDNFSAGGRPQPWAPLKYRQGTPLVNSGRLRGSITGEVQGNTVVLGTNLPYAAIHNYGGTVQIPAITARNAQALRFTIGGTVLFRRSVKAHAVTIPARPYMVLQEADTETMSQILLQHLTGGL